jgi:hypothetical protein
MADTQRKVPPTGATCEEASSLSSQYYIPCGRPAEWIVHFPRRGNGPFAMCAMCADHNVLNRNAQYVMQGEANDG